MADFVVTIDQTIERRICLEANDEEQAKLKAMNAITTFSTETLAQAVTLKSDFELILVERVQDSEHWNGLLRL